MGFYPPSVLAVRLALPAELRVRRETPCYRADGMHRVCENQCSLPGRSIGPGPQARAAGVQVHGVEFSARAHGAPGPAGCPRARREAPCYRAGRMRRVRANQRRPAAAHSTARQGALPPAARGSLQPSGAPRGKPRSCRRPGPAITAPAVLAWGIAAAGKQRPASPHPLAPLLGLRAARKQRRAARSRLRRLRSGPAAPASGLACGPPLSAASGQAVHATAAPTRRRRRRARRKEAPVTTPAQSRGLVTAVACTAWSLAGGASPPPSPPPPCGRGSARRGTCGRPCPLRAPRPRRSPWRGRRARGRTATGAPYARMASTPPGRAGAPLPRAAPGLGGRRAPGRCAGAGVAFAPGPGCGRSPWPPRGARKAGAGATARTPGRCGSRWHRGRCPSCGPFARSGFAPRPVPRPAPRPDRRRRPTSASKASKGDWSPLGPPNRAPTARGKVHSGPTRAGAIRAAACRGRGAACRAPLAPRPVPVLRAVRSAWSCTAVRASARAPLAGDGLNPARFAPRRCAAGCAGGLTPPPARGSG
jgi:hypothetical protein